MAMGLAYEGDGFIRRGPAVEVKSAKCPEVRAAGSAGSAAGEPTLQEVEQRARALRREYLNDLLCWLLDR